MGGSGRFTFVFTESELAMLEAALEEATIAVPPGPWSREDFASMLNNVEARLLF